MGLREFVAYASAAATIAVATGCKRDCDDRREDFDGATREIEALVDSRVTVGACRRVAALADELVEQAKDSEFEACVGESVRNAGDAVAARAMRICSGNW